MSPLPYPSSPFQLAAALQLGDILVSVKREGGRKKRAAVDPLRGVRWPNATIPFVFSSSIRELSH